MFENTWKLRHQNFLNNDAILNQKKTIKITSRLVSEIVEKIQLEKGLLLKMK